MKNKKTYPNIYRYRRIVEAKIYIDEHYHDKLDLDNVSSQANFSKYHFLRLFKKAFGKSPHQYLTEVRIINAKKYLEENHSVKDTCFKVGFESIPSFVTLFKKNVGITPSEYHNRRKKLQKEKVEFPKSFIPDCFANKILDV